MKTNKFSISLLGWLALIASSCSNSSESHKNQEQHTSTKTDTSPDVHAHTHDHAHQISSKKNGQRNDKGELIDAAGNLIMGCPSHKEMIGTKGDMCPKCGYMTMIPITWDITGVDTVRVTSLPDYNPPGDKRKAR